MMWGADLIAARWRGSRCGVYYVDLAGPSEDLPKGWAFLGPAREKTLLRDMARLIFDARDWRITGLIHAVVRSKTLLVNDTDVDLLSICWCCDHEADGSQPFLLTLPPEAIDLVVQRYGSLFSPDLRSLAIKTADAFGLYDPEPFENSSLAQFGSPESTEWFSVVEQAADRVLQERRHAENLHQQRMKALAAETEREIAKIESECAHLEDLVARYGSKLPVAYLARLPKFPQPPAGPVTDAIILSWASAEGSLPHAEHQDHRPPSLRLLHWVFTGQQAAVWDNLKRAGPMGCAAACRIRQEIETAADELARRRGSGSGLAAAIWVGIRRGWLSLLPPT
jgi:hypothetical protein